MDPPIKPRRDPEEQSLPPPRSHRSGRDRVVHSRRAARILDSESVSYSSSLSDQPGSSNGRGMRDYEDSYIPARLMAREKIEGESPISSLNSSLSNKLLRLDNSPSNNLRRRFHQEDVERERRGMHRSRSRKSHSFHEEDYPESPIGSHRSSQSFGSLGRMQKVRSRNGEMHKSRSRNNSHSFHDDEDYLVGEVWPLHSGDRRQMHKSRSRNSNSFHEDDYLIGEEASRQMHKSRSRSSYNEYDQYMEDAIRGHNSYHNRQHSSNSISKRGISQSRNRSSNSFPEQDDYLVGEEVHVNPSPRRRQNTSYTNLIDDDSDSVRDTWSMAKSAFSTLPKRQSVDIYDDESPSVSSRGGSYGSRRPVSRSSSIHSHLSGQSSHRSQNSRQVIMKAANCMASYESDYSIDSILSGEDIEVQSLSSAAASDRSRNWRDGKQQPKDAPTSSDTGFQYKLFNLEGLGIEFETSDTEDNQADDEASQGFDFSGEMEARDGRPWWVQHLEEEGLLEVDTSTVYSAKMPQKHQFGRDIHHKLAQDLGDKAINENTAGEADDISETSTVGIENDTGDWEERLWTVARKYYKEYNGLLDSDSPTNDDVSTVKSTARTLSDEATVEEHEQLYSEEFRSEQKGVLKFRSILMTCLKAYVEAFHQDVGKLKSAQKGTGDMKGDPCENDEWNDLTIDLAVGRYVPLAIATDLFEEAIKMSDDGAISFHTFDTSNDTETSVTSSAKQRAELVASIMVEHELDFFRKYQVITTQESTLASVTKQPNRKLVSSATNIPDEQTDLDKFLYGDLDGEDEKQENYDSLDVENATTKTEECEVRLRSAIVGIITSRSSDAFYSGTISWASILGKLLLANTQSYDATHEQDSRDVIEQSDTTIKNQVASLKHTQPTSELYVLRYATTFLLRALADQRQKCIDEMITFDDLKSLLVNKAFIRSRFDLQGPYSGVLSHLLNFHAQIADQRNMERCFVDDTNDYISLHELLVSMLYSHLETALERTGYNLQQVQVSTGSDETTEQEVKKDGGNDSSPETSIISIYNYANVVATCLEIGRAFHHLGVSLGRRQRDRTGSTNSGSKDNIQHENTVLAEIKAYRNALEAYKACMYTFSKAEENATTRDAQDQLQQLREAKMSVELHISDTLTCVGFCHDTKLGEHESALMAYRESLSLYIRHIGRFHKMVSNTLHNMGTIHTELRQWSEAASCYRQCLSIIKRQEEQERSKWIKSHRADSSGENVDTRFVSSMNEDIVCTLEGLGACLDMLGEYDASLVCLEQAIERMDLIEESSIHTRLLSQAANVVMKQASALSVSFNSECHLLLLSDNSSTGTNVSLLLANKTKKEHIAKDFIKKAIISRRQLCYENAGLCLETSAIATASQFHALAEDLVTAGRLEFRECSYAAAMSYFYEALAIRKLNTSASDNDKRRFSLQGFLEKGSMKDGKSLLRVSDDVIVDIVDSVTNKTADDSDEQTLQILNLIGLTHFRIDQYEKAKRAFSSSVDIAKARVAEKKGEKSQISVLISRINIAVCEVRLAFVASKMGDEVSVSSLQNIIETLNDLARKLNGQDVCEEAEHRVHLEIVINTELATAWYLLGKLKNVKNDFDHAMKCFHKTIKLLSNVHDSRLVLNSTQAIYAPLPFASVLLWEDPSAAATAMLITDAKQYSGNIATDESLRLKNLEEAVGSRERFMKLECFQSMDFENSIVCYDESQWNVHNLDCYSLLLNILENKGRPASDDSTEEKSWKSNNGFSGKENCLTKEDVLFRLGNLQAKLGLLNEAIESYKQAEQATVSILGKDHVIVSDILHNLGNTYRQLSMASTSHEMKTLARQNAMSCYTESIRISSDQLGSYHISLAESVQNQGLLHMGSENLWFHVIYEEMDEDEDEDNALDYLKRALSIRRKNKDNSNSIDLAHTLYLLGVLCLRIVGRNSLRLDADTSKLANDAINYFIETLKIQNLLLGDNHSDVANTLQCLGQAYFYRAIGLKNTSTKSDDDLVKAVETLTSSFEMRSCTQNTSTKQLIDQAHCLFLLGHAEEIRLNFAVSKLHFTGALQVLHKAGKHIGADLVEKYNYESMTSMEAINLLAARVLIHMAFLHKENESFHICIKYLSRGIQTRRACKSVKQDGISSAMVDVKLASVLLHQEKADKCLGYLSRSLRIFLSKFGKYSFNAADILFQMGKAFSMKSKFQKSILCYEKAMNIYEFKEQLAPKKKLGDIHSEIGRSMMFVGGDMCAILEHYRTSVSFFEAVSNNGAGKINAKLITTYSEMLDIMRDVFDAEHSEISQSELLDELGDVLHRLGNLHASSGKHEQAMVCFKEVLDIQQRKHGDREELRIADLLFNMGNIYVELKQPQKALRCLEESYGITKDALGGNLNNELHSTLFLLGVASMDLAEYESSHKWFTEALSVIDEADHEAVDDVTISRTLFRLGQVCQELGNYSEALSSFQECTKRLKPTSNDLELASALYSIGVLLQNTGDSEGALNCYDQSLRIRSEIADISVVVRTKESIGLALLDVGDYDLSLAYLADALCMKSRQSDDVCLDIGRMLMHVGQVYLLQGYHDTAKNYFEASLNVFDSDPDSALNSAVCLYNIAVILDEISEDGSLKKYLNAIQIFRAEKAIDNTAPLAMGLQRYDIVLARCLHQAAITHVQDKDCVEALQCMKESFELKRNIFGDNHKETAESQHWLGVIQLALGEDELALRDFKGALKARVTQFGTEHRDVAATLYGLAEVHFKRDEQHECLECIEENLRLHNIPSLKSDDNMISRSKLLLGSCCQELGRYSEANEHLSQALKLLIAVHGESYHLDVADAHFRLGICLCETNDLDGSIEHFKLAALARSSLLGDLDIECANTYESLGIVQQKKGSSTDHNDAISSFEKALAIKRASLPELDEDIAVLLQFIGTSLFAIGKYEEALQFFTSSANAKEQLYGAHDQEYAMTLLDKAAAYAKMGDEKQSMQCYSLSIESGGLPVDSWELGVAYKNVATYIFEQNTMDSIESFSEAVSIFEWILENEQPSPEKYNDVIECYVHLLEISDEPISEERGTMSYKLANCYVEVKKLKEAIYFYREAIMIQSQIFSVDHVSVANSLHNIGNCYRDYGDLEKSVECLTKALGILTLSLGDEHHDVADTCHCLGLSLTARSEFQDAIPLFERALALRRKQLGTQHISTASSLFNLGVVFQMIGSWTSAIKYCKEALKIQRYILGDNNPITLATLVCSGKIHYGKGDYEQAIKCFTSGYEQGNLRLLRELGLIYNDRGQPDKSILMFTEVAAYMAEILGVDARDDDLFSSLSALKQQTQEQDLITLSDDIMFYGSVLTYLDRFDEALVCFRISSVIYQAKYTSDHLAVAENLYRTGFVIEKLKDGDLNEALDILTEALRIRKLHLEPSHPDLAETLFTLAQVHHGIGNSRDAMTILAEAIDSRGVNKLGDSDSLLQIGQMQKEYGRYQEALGTFEECLRLKLLTFGACHSSIAELYFFIGDVMREVGDFDAAESKFKESLAILDVSKSDIIGAADVHFSLGILFTEQEMYTNALESYMKSLQGRKLEISTTKIDMAELLNNIGICYSGMKEYVKAQVYHAEALESLIEELGYEHPDVAFCWHSLGTVHTELNDLTEALSCLKNAVKIERSEIYLQSLGICLVKMNDFENAYVCLTEALQMKNLGNEDDDMAEIQRHIGIIWMKREKYEDAFAMFEEALKIKVALPPSESDEKFHQHLMECFDGALESVAILFGSDHLRYAKLLHQKGNIHSSNNEHSLAIEAYIVTLRIYKQHYGDSHLSVANSLFNLGVSLNAKGSPDKGLRCFVKALRVSKVKLGEDHLDVADTYEQIALSHKLLLKYNDAIDYFEKALNIRKHVGGGSELKASEIMHDMGKVYHEMKEYKSAEKAFKESLRIRSSKLGQDNTLVAESMFQLGSIYKDQGDMAGALKYCEECLRINKSQRDIPKSLIADIYYSLGEIHLSQDNSAKSLCCYSKAMSLYSEEHGPKNEKVISCLVQKGRVLVVSRDHTKALSCFSECLDRTRLLAQGPDTSLAEARAYALCQMGEIYSDTGEIAEASSHFSLALAAYRGIFGPNHIAVADVLQKMSYHYVKCKEFERGYSCAKEALTVRDLLFKTDDLETADSHLFMGKILFECSRYRESLKFMERARKIHLKELGIMSPKVAEENFLLGRIYEEKANTIENIQHGSQHDLDSALQHFQDALVAQRGVSGKDRPEVSTTLTRLGHIYYKLSEYDNSVECFSESLKLRETSRDESSKSHLLVADSLFDLGCALIKLLDTKRSLQLFTDALREYQVILDSKHLNVAKCLGKIGEVHEKENELTEAISYMKKAAIIYDYNFGTSEPNEKIIRLSSLGNDYGYQAETLYVLASAYDRIGEEQLSLKLYRQVLKTYKALYGRDSVQVAKVLNSLANMKGRAGSVEKAMVLFDESLRIRMLHLGNHHEDVAETLFGMGIVFEKRKNYPAAMKAYSDCLRIRSSRYGSDSMEVAQVVVNIGVVRGNKGDFNQALKSWNKALAIYRKHGLQDDDNLVATLLGHIHLAADLIRNRGKVKVKA